MTQKYDRDRSKDVIEKVYLKDEDGASFDPIRYSRLVQAGKTKEAEAMRDACIYKVKVNGKFI